MRKIFLPTLLLFCVSTFAQELKPTETEAVLNVSVVNNKKVAQPNQPVSFTSLKDGKIFKGTTDEKGSFSILIPVGVTYQVKYKAFNLEKESSKIEIPNEARLTFDYTIMITPPRVFTLDNVFFDSGKSTLRAESNKELNELAEYMSIKPSLTIEIAGHTDNVGVPEANQKLSEDRANAVRDYLIKKKISGERIVAKGYGDTKPVAYNDTPQGKQKNRRTEVKILTE